MEGSCAPFQSKVDARVEESRWVEAHNSEKVAKESTLSLKLTLSL